jgi:gamma-glutamyltranspeptidase
LYYDAKTKAVRGINASGRSPAALTLEHLRSRGITGQSVSNLYSEGQHTLPAQSRIVNVS